MKQTCKISTLVPYFLFCFHILPWPSFLADFPMFMSNVLHSFIAAALQTEAREN